MNPLLPDVQRIAVLRPNAIGDYMFTLPALAALRAAYPSAHIVLLGKRWHVDFVGARPGPVDEVIAVPAARGIGAPPDAAQDDAGVDAFVAAMRERRFDLAMQLYGGGRHSNPFMRRLGARVTVGLRAADAEPLDHWIAYDTWRNERLRLLEVVGLAGAPPVDLAPRIAVTAEDRSALQAGVDLPDAPLAVLQPGASDSRRHWPAERFAAVGDALAGLGAQVAINGSADEQGLAAQVASAMRAPSLDLSGRLSVSALAALLARSHVVVSNDTGPLHLAQAVGTPTVGIFWMLNLLTAAPLVAGPHRQVFSTRTRCSVCGLENVHRRCEHQVCFVDDVGVDQVAPLAVAAFRDETARRAAAAAPR